MRLFVAILMLENNPKVLRNEPFEGAWRIRMQIGRWDSFPVVAVSAVVRRVARAGFELSNRRPRVTEMHGLTQPQSDANSEATRPRDPRVTLSRYVRHGRVASTADLGAGLASFMAFAGTFFGTFFTPRQTAYERRIFARRWGYVP
jgi:hypothetical protein